MLGPYGQDRILEWNFLLRHSGFPRTDGRDEGRLFHQASSTLDIKHPQRKYRGQTPAHPPNRTPIQKVCGIPRSTLVPTLRVSTVASSRFSTRPTSTSPSPSGRLA